MHPTRPSTASLAVLQLLLLTAAVTLAACAGPATTPEDDPAANPTARSYSFRAVVRQLPDPQDPAKQLLLHHEPIPDWVSSEGYETGMPAMTMPFPPAEGVSLDGLAIGDWVQVELVVDWEADKPIQAVAIEEIEPETEVEE